VLLLIAAFGFHSYWVFKAEETDEFARSKRLDARNRRLVESGLKGWVLDRSGKLENALVRYRNDGGLISRDYPVGEAAAHVTGYSDFVFGSGGIEYAFREWLTEPAGLVNRALSPAPVGKDFSATIDSLLQKEVFDLLDRTWNNGQWRSCFLLSSGLDFQSLHGRGGDRYRDNRRDFHLPCRWIPTSRLRPPHQRFRR
jgi:hypothetical protein